MRSVASVMALNVASMTWLCGYGMRWCSVAVTQLGCSDGGGQITHMSWVTMKDKVHLEHCILDSR